MPDEKKKHTINKNHTSKSRKGEDITKKTEKKNEQVKKSSRLKKVKIPKIHIKHKRVFIFLVKLPVFTFITFFVSTIIFFAGLLAILSFKDIEIKSQRANSTIQKMVQFKYPNTEVKFSSIKLQKTPIKQMTITISANQLSAKHNKISVQVFNFPKFEMKINVKKLLSGNVPLAIGKIENNSVNIPIQVNNSKSNKNSKNNSSINQLKLQDRIGFITNYFVSLVQKTQYTLSNGVQLNNVSFNLYNASNGRQLTKIYVVDSYTKIFDTDRLPNKYKPQFESINKKIIKREQEQYKNSSKLVQKFQKIKNNFSSKVIPKIANINHNVVVHHSVINYEKVRMTLDGICNIYHGKVENCLFDVSGLPIGELSKNKIFGGRVKVNSTVDGDILAKIDNGNLKFAEFNVYLKNKTQIKQIYNNKDISNNQQKSIVSEEKPIKMKFVFSNNLQKIDIGKIFIYTNKTRRGEPPIIITCKDILLNDIKPVGGTFSVIIVQMRFKEIFKFLKHQQIHQLGNIELFNAYVNGSMSFKFNKNGEIIAIEDQQNFTISQIYFSTMDFSYDLSNYRTNFGLIRDEYIIDIIDRKEDKKLLQMKYNHKTKAISFVFNDFIISQKECEILKRIFFTEERIGYIKNFSADMKINGTINIPNIKNISNSIFDLRGNILNSKIEDLKDKGAYFLVTKQSIKKEVNILFDFGTSQIKNELFGFNKNSDDILRTNINIYLNDDKKKQELAKESGIKKISKTFQMEIKTDLNNQEQFSSNIVVSNELFKFFTKSQTLNLHISKIQNAPIEVFSITKNIKISQQWIDVYNIIISYMTIKKQKIDISKKNSHIKFDISVENSQLDNIKFQKAFCKIDVFNAFYFQGSCTGDILFNDKEVEFSATNKDGQINIKLPNMTALFKYFLPDTKINFAEMYIEGKTGVNEKSLMFSRGNAKINLQYNATDMFNTNLVKSFDGEFYWDKNILKLNQSKIVGSWFDAILDIIIDNHYYATAEGRATTISPMRRGFGSKKITDDNSYSVRKQGKLIKDFADSLFLNNIDFSTKNGKMTNGDKLMDVVW